MEKGGLKGEFSWEGFSCCGNVNFPGVEKENFPGKVFPAMEKRNSGGKVFSGVKKGNSKGKFPW